MGIILWVLYSVETYTIWGAYNSFEKADEARKKKYEEGYKGTLHIQFCSYKSE